MSNNVTSVRCYIEEYDTATGAQGLRLREKSTSRRVILGTTTPEQKQQFLQFLLAGRANRELMPALFDTSDEQDHVLVSGQLASDHPHNRHLRLRRRAELPLRVAASPRHPRWRTRPRQQASSSRA